MKDIESKAVLNRTKAVDLWSMGNFNQANVANNHTGLYQAHWSSPFPLIRLLSNPKLYSATFKRSNSNIIILSASFQTQNFRFGMLPIRQPSGGHFLGNQNLERISEHELFLQLKIKEKKNPYEKFIMLQRCMYENNCMLCKPFPLVKGTIISSLRD